MPLHTSIDGAFGVQLDCRQLDPVLAQAPTPHVALGCPLQVQLLAMQASLASQVPHVVVPPHPLETLPQVLPAQAPGAGVQPQ
jgi:hypothetical protein